MRLMRPAFVLAVVLCLFTLQSFVLLAQVSPERGKPPTPTPTPGGQPTGGHPIGGAFYDELTRYNQTLWDKSDGWSNGDPFYTGWQADNAIISGGQLALVLDNVGCPCSTEPYASGEYRTDRWYGYGRMEARFRAAAVSGTMAASLFTYSGPYDGDPWDEIDIEILGRDTHLLQLNYFTNGVGGHETVLTLPFDAAAGFHDYAFEWRPNSIKWFVDGVLVHTETGSRGPLPSHVGKIMVNYWPGTGVDEWLGVFTYPGAATRATYEWIRYTPLSQLP